MSSQENDLFPQNPNIDRIVHAPARLSIMANLYVVESADFLFIQKRTELTRGNLSAHMSILEKQGYIEVQKEFVDRIPRTLLRLTKKGRKAFQNYRRNMKDFFGELPD